jgi:hypothetical protein
MMLLGYWKCFQTEAGEAQFVRCDFEMVCDGFETTERRNLGLLYIHFATYSKNQDFPYLLTAFHFVPFTLREVATIVSTSDHHQCEIMIHSFTPLDPIQRRASTFARYGFSSLLV